MQPRNPQVAQRIADWVEQLTGFPEHNVHTSTRQLDRVVVEEIFRRANNEYGLELTVADGITKASINAIYLRLAAEVAAKAARARRSQKRTALAA